MQTAILPLKVRQHASYSRTFQWLDSRKRPVNLTGAAITLAIVNERDELVVPCTVVNGRLVIEPLLGKIKLVLSATDTASIAFNVKHAWDLRIVMPGGTVVYPIEGSITAVKSKTLP